MDQYQEEIRDLRSTLARLEELEADPVLIEEYAAEIRNLSAIYDAARETLASGQHDRRLRDALAELGFGEWSLDNVYSFVYDLAVELPLEEGRDLASMVNEMDFAGSLLESVDAGQG